MLNQSQIEYLNVQFEEGRSKFYKTFDTKPVLYAVPEGIEIRAQNPIAKPAILKDVEIKQIAETVFISGTFYSEGICIPMDIELSAGGLYVHLVEKIDHQMRRHLEEKKKTVVEIDEDFLNQGD